jgi:hypothetical protein
MTRTRLATFVLRIDAAANLAAALACLVAAGPLADVLRLDAAWPVVALAVVFAANGVACWRAAAAAGQPDPSALRRLAAVDVVFAAAVGLLALTDPTGMASGTRWALGGLADLTLVVGAAKLLTSRGARLPRAATVR